MLALAMEFSKVAGGPPVAPAPERVRLSGRGTGAVRGRTSI
jgi:hypothetical protein